MQMQLAALEKSRVLFWGVQDFFAKECWAHHPKPYAEFMEWRKKEDERWEMQRGRLVPGM
jgi:hypothetical protein